VEAVTLTVAPSGSPPDGPGGVGPRIEVRGGAGGTVAQIADLHAAATALDRAAGALEACADQATTLGALIGEAAVWSPHTAGAARAAVALLGSPWRGLRARAQRTRTVAEHLRATASLYETTDVDVAALIRQHVVVPAAATVGAAGPLVWAAGALLALATGAQVLGDVVVARLLRWSPGPAGALIRAAGDGAALDDAGPRGALARTVGGPGLLPTSLGWPTARSVEPLVPVVGAFLLGATNHPAAGPPSSTVPHAASVLLGGSRTATLLLGTPTSGLVVTPVVRARKPRQVATPPSGIGDVMDRVDAMYARPDGSGAAPGSVGIERLEHADGSVSWLVAIPGTEVWSPVAGSNPLDLTSDLTAVAGSPDDATAVATKAMLLAGIRPDEPVMLAGHSLGGLVAMNVAQDPAIQDRFTIAAVVTAGSPVALADGALPVGAQALHLEHLQDDVPALDGAMNPDDPQRTTVVADLNGVPWVPEPSVFRTPVDAHAVTAYASTARGMEGWSDASVQAFQVAADRVLGGITRVSSDTAYTGVRLPADR
jgi:hypothetical protein